MNDQREFAMFCTIGGGCWLFAVVADEIEAVRAYSSHVEYYGRSPFDGRDHRPHIHMEPMRAEWDRYESSTWPKRVDPAANLFRQPAEVSS